MEVDNCTGVGICQCYYELQLVGFRLYTFMVSSSACGNFCVQYEVVQNGVQVMLMPELQRMFFEDFSVGLVKESYAEGGWLIETNVRHLVSIRRISP